MSALPRADYLHSVYFILSFLKSNRNGSIALELLSLALARDCFMNDIGVHILEEITKRIFRPAYLSLEHLDSQCKPLLILIILVVLFTVTLK